MIYNENNKNDIRFSVPFNWQNDMRLFLGEGDIKGNISEVYARLPKDNIGGGRAAFSLPFVSKKNAVTDIAYFKRQGLKFNYILNAVCAGNREFTDAGYKSIRALLDWLSEAGVYAITVSMPYLAQIIAKHYPEMKIFVSAMAEVDTVDKVLFWESLGVDKITLPAYKLNRNFELLHQMQKNAGINLQLIVNNGCILNCPFAQNHASASAHASNKKHKSCGIFPDINFLMCRHKRCHDKSLFMKSDFIRPEDLSFYHHKTGVLDFKLVDRRCSTKVLKTIVNAYFSGSYEGNLADLLPVLAGKSYNVHDRWYYKLSYLKTLLKYSPFDMKAFGDVISPMDIKINNKRLDGFVQEMAKRGCQNHNCKSCGICEKYMEKAFLVDDEYLKTQETVLKQAIDKLL